MTSDESLLLPSEIKARINGKKRTRGDAVTRLCKATARHVRDNSDKLAEKLFDRALEGDVNCTKLLVTLIEKLPPPKRRSKRQTMLEALLKSREWDPEIDGPSDYELELDFEEYANERREEWKRNREKNSACNSDPASTSNEREADKIEADEKS